MSPVTLILFLSILTGLSSAQNSSIEVDFDTAPRVKGVITLTVPRVNHVILKSASTIMFVSGAEDQCQEGQESRNQCTLDLITDPKESYFLNLQGSINNETASAEVIVNVNENYTVACSKYVFPVQLNLTVNSGSFTCVPVFVTPPNTADDIIDWYRSSSSTGINATLVNETRVVFTDSNNISNATLNFISAAISDAAYYFPVSGDVDPLDLSMVSPVLVSYKPLITSRIMEFSVDFYSNPNVFANHIFFCVVRSFPAANVLWRYTAQPVLDPTTETPVNISLSQGPEHVLDRKPVKDSDEYNYTLTIVKVGLTDSGIYTCLVDNEAFRIEDIEDPNLDPNGHSFRLRVKDYLRQLWPAIGFIGVIILVVIAILLGALFDYLVGKTKSKEEPPCDNQRTFSVTSNSSGSPEGNQLAPGHVALRRLSSAKVQLLEEPR